MRQRSGRRRMCLPARLAHLIAHFDDHAPSPERSSLGVAGHEGSTVLVGLNGLRLLRHRWQRPGE